MAMNTSLSPTRRCLMSAPSVISILLIFSGLAVLHSLNVTSSLAEGRSTLGRSLVDDSETLLKVTFKIQRGRVAVDRDHSTFAPTPGFISDSKTKDPEKLKR